MIWLFLFLFIFTQVNPADNKLVFEVFDENRLVGIDQQSTLIRINFFEKLRQQNEDKDSVCKVMIGLLLLLLLLLLLFVVF